jgi:cbb3-type cytochrome oxidase subunit 3
MGLAEDLKALKELREKGEISETDYTTARDAALGKQTPPTMSRKVGRFIGLRAIPLVILLLLLLAVLWYNAGSRKAIATVVRAPITLKDEVQNIPASSWKAIDLEIPYSGTVTISLEIVQGNPIDVLLTTPDQLDAMKKEDWTNVRFFANFSATKTKTYRRVELLGQGSYYLVLRDTSLGILSSSASDISVKVQLTP